MKIDHDTRYAHRESYATTYDNYYVARIAAPTDKSIISTWTKEKLLKYYEKNLEQMQCFSSLVEKSRNQIIDLNAQIDSLTAANVWLRKIFLDANADLYGINLPTLESKDQMIMQLEISVENLQKEIAARDHRNMMALTKNKFYAAKNEHLKKRINKLKKELNHEGKH